MVALRGLRGAMEKQTCPCNTFKTDNNTYTHTSNTNLRRLFATLEPRRQNVVHGIVVYGPTD